MQIDDNFIAQYQMNYGETPVDLSDHTRTNTEAPPQGEPVDWDNIDTNSDEYKKQYFDYYAYYYGQEKAVEYCGYDYYEGQGHSASQGEGQTSTEGQQKEETENSKEEKKGKNKKGEKRKKPQQEPRPEG